MTAEPAGQKKPNTLPRLREDLTLGKGAAGTDGGRSWLIYDPVKHAYLQIDQRSYQMLSLWPGCQTAAQLIARAQAALGLSVTGKEIESLAEFLVAHQLARSDGDSSWKGLWERQRKGQHGVLMTALHSYLFFRIPLLRPEAFLRATAPLVAPLFTRTAGVFIALIGLAGLYLTSRQWDAFVTTLMDFLSFEGAAGFAVVLFVVKALHELGHAYTALRFGCRVPVMGIAVMMLAPMLYTDVTDAWQVKTRRQRVLIGAAGVIVELALASMATLVWALSPPGFVKSVAFAVATVGWILSLAINLNPLMRFDGYFVLADALGVENLQERSFALGRWKMREALFALGVPRPETFAPALERFLIGYAWAVWIYRAILFTGIAFLVYALFFKALGIMLFLVEIIYFVAGPLWRELASWGKLRGTIVRSRRTLVTAAVAAGVLMALVLPWSTHVDVPGVLQDANLAWIYPPRPAEVVSVRVKMGDEVKAGDVLVELASAEIGNELRATEIRARLTELRLARRMADDADREESMILERELISLRAKLAGLQREKRELTLRAPASGKVIELNATLHPGRWVGRDEFVALIGEGRRRHVKGYVSETDLRRVSPEASGRFIPDDLMQSSLDVRLIDVAESGASAIEIHDLAAKHGGAVETISDAERRREIPATAQYLVRLAPAAGTLGSLQSVRGIVRLEAEPASPLSRFLRHAAGVLIRESGF